MRPDLDWDVTDLLDSGSQSIVDTIDAAPGPHLVGHFGCGLYLADALIDRDQIPEDLSLIFNRHCPGPSFCSRDCHPAVPRPAS
jgi:hypothetical protein